MEAEILSRLDNLAQAFERLEGKLQKSEENLDGKLQQLEERLDEKLKKSEERLDEKLQQLEERLDGKLQQLEERLDEKLQQLEERLEGKLERGFSEVSREMAALTSRVDIMKEAIDSLDENVSGIQQLLEYHQDKWLDHDKEIWRLKRKA